MERRDKVKRLKYIVTNKKGAEMVEASISMPLIILTIFLLLRLFTFYLSILTTGINEHEKAFSAWETYSGVVAGHYENEKSVWLLSGGLLKMDVSKDIKTEAFFYNEDNMVRASELVKK